MPGTIITITSGKGGVGKTTTTANLATALAMLGQRVIALDADIGLRNLDIIMGLENRIMHDIVDVVEHRCALSEALVSDHRTGSLAVLPAAQTRDKTDISIAQMESVCSQLRSMADFILIDSPAGIEHGFHNAVAPADKILLVTTPDVSALRDADKVIYLLENELHRQPWLILNRYNAELSTAGEMRDIDDVLDILAIDLLGVVPEDNQILLATDRGLPAVYNSQIHSGLAYQNIARRILGQNVPLLRFRRKRKGPFQALLSLFWRRRAYV
ncbi:MAG: septum site-determining protein MinD [Chloroflexota bacterium]